MRACNKVFLRWVGDVGKRNPNKCNIIASSGLCCACPRLLDTKKKNHEQGTLDIKHIKNKLLEEKDITKTTNSANGKTQLTVLFARLTARAKGPRLPLRARRRNITTSSVRTRNGWFSHGTRTFPCLDEQFCCYYSQKQTKTQQTEKKTTKVSDGTGVSNKKQADPHNLDAIIIHVQKGLRGFADRIRRLVEHFSRVERVERMAEKWEEKGVRKYGTATTVNAVGLYCRNKTQHETIC